MGAVLLQRDGGGRRSEEDQLWCDSQEEVLKLTGSIINTGRSYPQKNKKPRNVKVAAIVPPLANQLRGVQDILAC